MRRKSVESRGFSADRLRLERAGELVLEDMVALEQGDWGGARVYYLDLPARGVTHLLAIFGKREKDDLSVGERQALAALVRVLKEEAR